MNLSKIKTWVKGHTKQVALGAAGVAVVLYAAYRKRAAASASGLNVGFSPQQTGTDPTSSAYDQFTSALGQISTAQQQQSDSITSALGQLGDGIAQGQGSIFDAMQQNADQQNAATGGILNQIMGALAQPASPAAPKPAPKASTYTFRPGDTIDSVARQLGTTVGSLLAANPLSGKNFTAAGHKITTPTAKTNTAGPTPTIVYTPGKGESNASIAAKFGITTAQLTAANSKSGQPLNTAGHRITIPGR